MDLHRYAALRRLWRRSPPLQSMVQSYLGIEAEESEPPPEPGPTRPMTAEEEEAAIQRFIANFAAAGGLIH